MESATPLGEFLRVRRGLLRPDEPGLAVPGRRRVAGLRREEVAALAGVSADYYTRLEQGRSRHPSAQVVDAIARALRLDPDGTAHLHRLALPAPRRPAPAPHVERAPATVVELLDAWDPSPAFIAGRTLDVLAANAAARALSPMHEVGGNLLRTIFLDPAAPATHPDHVPFGERIVATVRATAGAESEPDPALDALVQELTAGSEEFRRLWGRHLVRGRGHGTKHFVHPALGEVALDYRTFAVNGADAVGLTLIAYSAGGAVGDALSSLTASDRPG